MTFQDIHISDNNLLKDFVGKFNNKEYAEAFQIIENNPQLDSKAITAENINYIVNFLHSLESETYNGTLGYMEEKSISFNEIINEFINRNDWDSSIEYKRYNFVVYNNSVYMYINSNPSSGHSPTDENYWAEFGLRGKKGADGSGLNYKGAWNNVATYNPLDFVKYNGAGWVAKTQNTNQTPSETSSSWSFLARPEVAKIEISSSQPTKIYDGQIWMEILT